VWAQGQPRSRQPRIAKGKPQDQKAVADMMTTMTQAWNAGNATAYADNFADQADYIDAGGAVYTTRDQFQQRLAELFRTAYKGAHADIKVRRLYFARPRVLICDLDVTITKYRSAPPGFTSSTGQPLQVRLRYVLSSESKGWLILAGQETQVRKQEAPEKKK
jgi:uncharacterized protein (TIGR02246 family)